MWDGIVEFGSDRDGVGTITNINISLFVSAFVVMIVVCQVMDPANAFCCCGGMRRVRSKAGYMGGDGSLQ